MENLKRQDEAAEVHAKGQELLQQAAQNIRDPALRQSFLQSFPDTRDFS